MSYLIKSLGLTLAVGAMVVSVWDHIRAEEYRKWTQCDAATNPENYDYENPRTAEEYLDNNERRELRRTQIEDVVVQKQLTFSLLFLAATIAVVRWLS